MLYDFCQDHGIKKLATEEHCYLTAQIVPCVSYWIVKDAFQSFNRFCYVWRNMRNFEEDKSLVEEAQVFVANWLLDPNVKVPNHLLAMPVAPVDYVVRQCYLMMEVIMPLKNTPTDATRRLCLYEDSMVKQLRRHRLLHALKDYLP